MWSVNNNPVRSYVRLCVSDGMAASCSYWSLCISAETSSHSHPAADVSLWFILWHLSGIVLRKSNVLGVSRYLKWFAFYKSTLLLWSNLRHGMTNCYYVSPFRQWSDRSMADLSLLFDSDTLHRSRFQFEPSRPFAVKPTVWTSMVHGLWLPR